MEVFFIFLIAFFINSSMKLESCVNVKNLIVTQIMCQINHELKKKLNLRKNLFGFMKKRNGEEKNRGIMFLHDLKKRLICFVEKSSNLILIYFSCHPNLFIGFNHSWISLKTFWKRIYKKTERQRKISEKREFSLEKISFEKILFS